MSNQISLFKTLIPTLTLPILLACGLFAPKPTPTPLPTATPTPPPPPTAIFTPTASSSEERPDISGAVIVKSDLPADFEEVPPEELGLSPEELSSENFTVENVFAFLNPKTVEIILGFNSLLLTTTERLGFDVAINNPDLFMTGFVQGFGPVESQEELTGFDDIGETALATSVSAKMESVPMKIEMVLFRRENVGAFIAYLYPEGTQTTVTLHDLATTLDARITQMLPLTP
ncbi:MAG: hypothetical protein D6770_04980 [Anaerolineae bacterium]|nr:MAG: hypothetical protein D6770_04980 [Anaerolineae bacterium]